MNEYALQYEQKILNDEHFLFFPITILKGKRVDDTFVTESNEKFSLLSDTKTIDRRNYCFSADIIEEELLELYDTDDINEAINKYYEESNKEVLIGKIDRKNNSLDINKLSLDKIMGLVHPIGYGINNDGMGTVVLTKAQLHDMLLENNDKLRAILNKHLKGNDSLENLFLSKGITYVNLSSDSKIIKGFAVSKSIKDSFDIMPSKEENKHIDTMKVYQYVTERLVGQDDSVEDIISAVINNIHATDSKELIKPFIIGPTGSGKSLLFELLGKYLDIPVIVVDCNVLVQAGYEGKNVEDVLKDLYQLCDKDVSKANRAIVLFDEIDKIANSGASVSDVGVQQALLKFIEGNKYVIELDKFSGESVTIDTSMMTIAATGAFDSLTTSVTKQLGFNSKENKEYKKIDMQQLRDYGMISELLARFNLFVQYNKVSEEMLYDALTKSEISPLKIKEAYYLKNYHLKINFNESFIKKVCQDAIEKNSGFRGLNQVVNSSLTKLSFKLQCSNNLYKEAIIDEKIIDNPKEYTLIKK